LRPRLGRLDRDAQAEREGPRRHLQRQTSVRRYDDASFGADRIRLFRGAAVAGAVVPRGAITATAALASAHSAATNERRETVGAERTGAAGTAVHVRANAHLTAVLHALPPAGAIARRKALDLAETGFANEPVGALRIVDARLAARGTTVELLLQLAVSQIAGLGAHAADAALPAQTIRGGAALVTALRVDRADLPSRALRVVRAKTLRLELTDVKRSIADDATEPRRAIARALASDVASPKRANQGRFAVRIEQTPLGETAEARIVAHAPHRDDHDETRGNPHPPQACAKEADWQHPSRILLMAPRGKPILIAFSRFCAIFAVCPRLDSTANFGYKTTLGAHARGELGSMRPAARRTRIRAPQAPAPPSQLRGRARAPRLCAADRAPLPDGDGSSSPRAKVPARGRPRDSPLLVLNEAAEPAAASAESGRLVLRAPVGGAIDEYVLGVSRRTRCGQTDRCAREPRSVV
jgi:hypothetical protein